MDDSIKILSTRELPEKLINQADESGLKIVTSPFIKVEPIENVEVQQEIEHAAVLELPVIFSSANAVEAVLQYLDEAPLWRIYCVGRKTAGLVKAYFPASELAAVANSASELADIILEQEEPAEILFFCGDLRRDELPDKLKRNGWELSEIQVYQTTKLPHPVPGNFAAVLFFSPSGVESYFSMNKIAPSIPLFAIGETTANAIRKNADNEILLPEQPSVEEMMELLIDFFK